MASSTLSGGARRRLVVGIDYGEPSRLALHTALDLARSRPSELHVIAVAEGNAPGPREISEQARREFLAESQRALDAYLNDVLARHPTGGERPEVFTAVDFGSPTERILALAEKVQADLVVVGTHGRTGIDRLVVGSVAENLLRHARCSVLVVRAK